ncbi:MAG: hypothetical protein M1825_002318 [Sarcosagium campestre]|nr:MAG: hypothetical protein M1825_002318 [Sarcosagium campestre]
MDSTRYLADLPGIHISEFGPLGDLTSSSSSSMSYEIDLDVYSQEDQPPRFRSSLFTGAASFPWTEEYSSIDNVQQFLTHASSVYNTGSTSGYRKSVLNLSAIDLNPPCGPLPPYPYTQHQGPASPIPSCSDDTSAIDRCPSSTGSVWSPLAGGGGDGESSFSSEHMRLDHPELLSFPESVHAGPPSLLHAGFRQRFPHRSGPLSGRHHHHHHQTGTYVNPQEVMQFPDILDEDYHELQSLPELDFATSEAAAVQDPVPDSTTTTTTTTTSPALGYQRAQDASSLGSISMDDEDSPHVSMTLETGDHHHLDLGPATPALKQRRRPSKTKKAVTISPSSSSKVNRNGTSTQRITKSAKRSSQKASPQSDKHADEKSCVRNTLGKKKQHTQIRPFACVFGAFSCHATFGSKNEWKRHVSAQHVRERFWRCDMGTCASLASTRGPNDFNRKDLFMCHLQRMHCPVNWANKDTKPQAKRWAEKALPAADARCAIFRRSPPSISACVVCGERFTGEGSWDRRMEHVGSHYEKGEVNGAIGVDDDLKAWMQKEGLISRDHVDRWVLVGGGGAASDDSSPGAPAASAQWAL